MKQIFIDIVMSIILLVIGGVVGYTAMYLQHKNIVEEMEKNCVTALDEMEAICIQTILEM
jgi:hypothetical protein